MHPLKSSAVFILMLAAACTRSHSPKSTPQHEPTGSISSLSINEGRYRIDTNIILSNKNLIHLINELERSNVKEKSSVKDIPPFILTFLDSITGDFSIADPGEEWQVGCVVMGKPITRKVYDEGTKNTLVQVTYDNSQPLLRRQLINFLHGDSIAVLTYYTGGIGKMSHIVMLEYNGTTITDLWCGNFSFQKLGKKETIKYLLDNKDKDWGLNTNLVFM